MMRKTEKKTLILATCNEGKAKEIKNLLSDIPLEILSLNSFNRRPSIIENSSTFAGNAVKKAETVSRFYKQASMADDSGLEVEALGGKPGVLSARYSGENATDEENNAKLLKALEGVPEKERKACFRCAIAIAIPGKKTVTVEGECRGHIALKPRGSKGFGYDPLFVYEPAGKTFAELDPETKNKISHRGRALQKARTIIEELLEI